MAAPIPSSASSPRRAPAPSSTSRVDELQHPRRRATGEPDQGNCGYYQQFPVAQPCRRTSAFSAPRRRASAPSTSSAPAFLVGVGRPGVSSSTSSSRRAPPPSSPSSPSDPRRRAADAPPPSTTPALQLPQRSSSTSHRRTNALDVGPSTSTSSLVAEQSTAPLVDVEPSTSATTLDERSGVSSSTSGSRHHPRRRRAADEPHHPRRRAAPRRAPAASPSAPAFPRRRRAPRRAPAASSTSRFSATQPRVQTTEKAPQGRS